MKTLTLYIGDEMTGATVEQKTYNVIAEGYGEAGIGYIGAPGEPDHGANLDMVCKKFKVVSATAMTGEHSEGEWEVVIEASDDDIEEYDAVLKELE